MIAAFARQHFARFLALMFGALIQNEAATVTVDRADWIWNRVGMTAHCDGLRRAQRKECMDRRRLFHLGLRMQGFSTVEYPRRQDRVRCDPLSNAACHAT
jgi:hypothetical protein